MLGNAVLDVRRYPTAPLLPRKITKLEAKSTRGLPQFEIAGDFTLHGTTKPVSFTVDVEEVKGWLRIRGAFAILQSQFGIKPYSKLFRYDWTLAISWISTATYSSRRNF